MMTITQTLGEHLLTTRIFRLQITLRVNHSVAASFDVIGRRGEDAMWSYNLFHGEIVQSERRDE